MNDNRNSSALFRRADQLERWIQSTTNKQTSETKRPTRIKFSRETIFLAACKSNDKEEIKDLVQSGVDVNTGNTDGLTALHQACIDGNLDMVEYLISLGAAVNVADSEGWTPLHATASCGFVSVARYLIEMGANNSAVNYDGDLPIDTAVGDEMVQLLQNDIDEKGIDVDECRAQEKNKLMQDVEIWAKNGIHEMGNNSIGGATPLHVAAAKGYLEVVSGLLKRCKVNVDAVDSEGWTPLHAAAHFNQRQVAETLIQHGADMEILNAAGLNCIEVSDSELVQWLQQKMAVYVAAVQTNKAIMANKRPPPALRDPLYNKVKRVERGNTDLTPEDIKNTEMPKPDPVHEITIGQRPEICTPPPATRTSEIIEKNSIDDTISWKNIPKIRKNTGITGSNESFTSGREIIPDSNVSIRRRPSTNDSDKECLRVVPTEDVLSPQSVLQSPTIRSFVPPVRDDESESQRKAHAKRARETRRSTQGVTLDELKSAEQLVKVKKTGSSNGTPPSQIHTARSNDSSTEKNFALEDATKPTVLSNDPTDVSTLPKAGTTALSRRSPTTVNSVTAVLPTLTNVTMESAKTTNIYASSNKLSGNTSSPANLQTTSSNTTSKLPVTLANTTDATFTLSLPRQISSETAENKISTCDKAADDKDQSPDQNRAPSAKNIVRRRRLKRRSTGVNQVDIDDVPCTPNGDSEQSGTDVDEGTGVGVNHAGDGLDDATDDNLDYKALWQASTAEVKVLRAELRDAKSIIDTLNQMNQNPMSEIEKREKRAMERKLSEMEEELKQLQKLKAENERLKAENRALTRVVSKLTNSAAKQ